MTQQEPPAPYGGRHDWFVPFLLNAMRTQACTHHAVGEPDVFCRVEVIEVWALSAPPIYAAMTVFLMFTEMLAQGRWGGAPLPDTPSTLDAGTVETLVDLARQGDESTFRDLARSVGVSADDLDDFWTWTIRRLRQERKQ